MNVADSFVLRVFLCHNIFRITDTLSITVLEKCRDLLSAFV